MSFSEIPVLDLSRSHDPASKPGFLADLRRAVLEVGFLYISNTGIDPALTEEVIREAHAFFELPAEAKLKVQMRNEKSFLGYNLLGHETTANATDWREQIDISTPHPLPSPEAPPYHNLLAPNQWPSASLLPSFRPTYEAYIAAMSKLSIDFTSLIAEALGMPATAFDRFFDKDQQHKVKIVRYPDLAEIGEAEAPDPVGGDRVSSSGQKQTLPTDRLSMTAPPSSQTMPPSSQTLPASERQGVGPHKDSMLTSYLLQATPHRGLQARNISGEWIDCPPKPGTLVVALGQGLEALTEGVCASTTHRVLCPAPGAGARISVPFFQGVSYDATFESVDVPAETRREKDEILARNGGTRDDVEFTFVRGKFKHLGEATLWNRCRSHPDVAQRWYPEIWKAICVERERKKEKDKEMEMEMEKGLNGVGGGNEVNGVSGGVVGQSAKGIEAH